MNREYNDNREYKNALDELHFSEEAKNRMVERLMERAEQPAPRGRRPCLYLCVRRRHEHE